MSIEFCCMETCIFPDFEDYAEPFEEDYLDYLLENENEEIQDSDEVWQPAEACM